MNILVTGATGFVGSRLIDMRDQLFNEGDKLICLSSRQIDNIDCVLHRNYEYSVNDFYKKGISNIDGVIYMGHFLQELHPDMSSIEGNIASVNNVIHLMNNLPNMPRIFVYCSSMAVYGENRNDLVDEQSELHIKNEYAASKYMIELYLREKCKENNINLHILRLAHIYGPGDRRRYTIPIWLQAAKNKQSIKLFADPMQKRNCLYIDDCCRFLAKAVYLEEEIEIINLASTHNATMEEIAQLCKKVSKNSEDVVIKQDFTETAGLGFLNCDRRKRFLGDEEYSLLEGLIAEYNYFSNKD